MKDFAGDSVTVKFKSDTQSNKKGFEAVYTFVSLDGCKYWLIYTSALSVIRSSMHTNPYTHKRTIDSDLARHAT